MNYAEIKDCDIANGTGIRVSLFVSGCRHHCKDCFNPMTWDFEYGSVFDEKIEQHLLDLLKPSHITGLTLLGGEPMEPENQKVLRPFLEKVKTLYPQKTVWCYTGYTYEALCSDSFAHTNDTIPMLEQIDVLVDGPFLTQQRNLMLAFRGSENQRIIDVPASIKKGDVILHALNK